MVHQRCCIPCCRNDSRTCEKVISFHGIPKDPVMRKKWLQRIEFTEDRLKKHTKVCSLHFCPEDFEPYELRRRMLRKGVLPSRFLKEEDGLHALRPMRRRRSMNKISKEPTACTIVNPGVTVPQNFHVPSMSPVMAGRLLMSPNQIPFAFPFPYGMSPFLHSPLTPTQMNSLLMQNHIENTALKVKMEPPQLNPVPNIGVPLQSNQQLKACLPATNHDADLAIDLTQLKQADEKLSDKNNSQIPEQPLQVSHKSIADIEVPMMLDSRQVKSQTSILWPMARLYRRGERHEKDMPNDDVMKRQEADAALRQLTAQHQLIFASMNKQASLPQPVTSLQTPIEANCFEPLNATQNQLGSVVNTPDSLPPNVQLSVDNEEGELPSQTCPKVDDVIVKSNAFESDSRVVNSFSRQDSKKSLSNIISRLREKVTEDPKGNKSVEQIDLNPSIRATENKNGIMKYSPVDLSFKDGTKMVTIMKIVERHDEQTTRTKLMIQLPPKEPQTMKSSTTSKDSRQIVLEVVQSKATENDAQLTENDQRENKDSVSESTPLDLSVREEKWIHSNGYNPETNILHSLEMENKEMLKDSDDQVSKDISATPIISSKQLYQLPLKKSSEKQDGIDLDILQILSSHDNPTQLLEDKEFTLRLFHFVSTCNASSSKIFSLNKRELPAALQALDLSRNGTHVVYSPDDQTSPENRKQNQTSPTGESNKNLNKYSVVFDKRLKVLHAKEAAAFYETVYKYQMPEGVMDEAYLLNHFSIQKVPLQGSSGQYVYFCSKCIKTLTDFKTALEHVKKHSERKRFKCKTCSKTYSSIGMIESHVERYVPPDEKKLDCEVCTKKFAFRGSLMMHLKLVHRDMEEVRCNLCHKEIKRHYLNTHMKRHRNERPHKCNICGKGFVAKKVLTTHLSIHTGYKPYKCQYCGRGFTVKSNMQLHERTHTGDRPFICTVCGKDFINRGTLKGHMLTRHHINLGKVHKCRHCTDSFTRLKTLVEHMEKSHKHLYKKVTTSLKIQPQEMPIQDFQK